MNEFKKIPWTRVSVEGVAIVASLLMAFAIDAWWEDRGREADYLAQLRVFENEVAANHESVDQAISFTADKLRMLNLVLSTLANEEEIPSTIYFDLGASLWHWDGHPAATAALIELLNSGTLQMIENSRLAVAIGEYKKSVENLESAIQSDYAAYKDSIFPVLRDQIVLSELGWGYDEIETLEGTELLETPKAPFTVEAENLRSLEVWNTLYQRKISQTDVLYTMQSASSTIVKLRALLEDEIAQFEQ